MSSSLDVIVVGGGVAGISAAVHLADAGMSVTLLEQRKLLGGRAGSFEHGMGPGGLLDTSPHVLLGCCTELRSLYARLGVSHLIRFDDVIEFADHSGRRARLRAVPLPSPLHLGPAIPGFNLLTFSQRAQIVCALVCMYFSGEGGRFRRAGQSFREYLKSIGQCDDTIRDYWDVVIVSALNEPCADASAKYGMKVFQETLLGGTEDYWLGYATAPLAQLYANVAGVEVRASAGVRSLNVEDGRVTGVTLSSGEVLRAREVVLAANPGNALALLRPVMHMDGQLAAIEKLQFRPILGAHLLYDRPVPLKHPVSLLQTRLQWVFPDPIRPELIHGVVSAADLLAEPTASLPGIFDREIKSALPELAGCHLVDELVVKEMRATFRPLPGIDELRPTQQTRIPGLTLAGDYTRTDWPATMEGAARSGRFAGESILDSKIT